MEKFKEKTILVTGGSSGIGQAAVELFKQQGAQVVFTGRNEGAIKRMNKNTGAEGFISDHADMSAMDVLVKEVTSRHPKIDVLFINAGIAAFAPIEAATEEHYDNIMDINVKGAFFTLQKFSPYLNEGASVIFLSSVNAYNAMENTAVYAASKAALIAIMKVAAIELAPKKIRVNAVCPGPVDTPLWNKVGIPDEQLTQVASLIQSKVPLRKFGSSKEIAKTVLFLASDASSFTTGAEFVIDGGFNLNTLV